MLAMRHRSEALIAALEPEDLILHGMADASPPNWHLGQTNWFFDTFVLQRLNRDLQGDADPTQFRYRARWQAKQQRIDMVLLSTQDQTVHLGGEA